MSTIQVACGGTESTMEGPDPVPEVNLEYSKIAGQWRGTVTEIRTLNVYPAALSVSPRAPKGAVVGTVIYGTALGECTGDLVADAASDQKYEFVEFIQSGPCVPRVAVELKPFAAGDSLEYVAMNIVTRVPCCTARLGRP
jgi:hypothetical protein